MFQQNGSLLDEQKAAGIFCVHCGIPFGGDGQYCESCISGEDVGRPCACGTPSKKFLCHNEKSTVFQKFYYACAKDYDDKTRCGFYEMEGGPQWEAAPKADEDCWCGQRAVIRVCRKSDKPENIGRKLISCEKKKPHGCDYFKWASPKVTKADKLRAARAQHRAAMYGPIPPQ